MCGIFGLQQTNECFDETTFIQALDKLNRRGPDYADTYTYRNTMLGHTRLSIIDTSHLGNQPMHDLSERYTIVFNGEVYNFNEIKKYLINRGISFKSKTDTEVILYLYIVEGAKCLERLNGFFSFAIYDKCEDSIFLARDRMGIKPLYLYSDVKMTVFASEMKALYACPIEKKIDEVSLVQYLQLNYIPEPNSILKNVKKVPQGSYAYIKKGRVEGVKSYYSIPYVSPRLNLGYSSSVKHLRELLEKSVENRMLSDVPLGCFLSGGIDSTIIAGIAAQRNPSLQTFSIGYKDNPYFDETAYALVAAEKFKTNHTIFKLSNDDLLEHLYDILYYIDEPFADSSSIAVYILSQKTKSKVSVALSGDGADEMFAGYNKHRASWMAGKNTWKNTILRNSYAIWNRMPASRSNKWSNIFRQIKRYSNGLRLSHAERYWSWCTFIEASKAKRMLSKSVDIDEQDWMRRQKDILKYFKCNDTDLYADLYTDMHLVLTSDMLVKVDRMSMANSLEVRVPFLDHQLVDFAFSLPTDYKIDRYSQKKILKEACMDILPKEILNRNKKGFEVPLLQWFRKDLKGMIFDRFLSSDFITSQDLFDLNEINKLKDKLMSKNPEDVHAQIWGLIVFQSWWERHFNT